MKVIKTALGLSQPKNVKTMLLVTGIGLFVRLKIFLLISLNFDGSVVDVIPVDVLDDTSRLFVSAVLSVEDCVAVLAGGLVEETVEVDVLLSEVVAIVEVIGIVTFETRVDKVALS